MHKQYSDLKWNVFRCFKLLGRQLELLPVYLQQGRRKKTDQSVNVGGGSTPSPKPKYFFFRKEEKMQKYFVTFLQGYPLKLGHFSRNVHKIFKVFSVQNHFFLFIKNIRFRPFWIFCYAYRKIRRKKNSQKSPNIRFLPYRGRGLRTLLTGPQLFFFLRLPLVLRGKKSSYFVPGIVNGRHIIFVFLAVSFSISFEKLNSSSSNTPITI